MSLQEAVLHAFKEKLPAKRPGFEARQPQLDIAVAAAQGIEDGRNVVMEAGTGTGKSYGYLVPAMEWLRENPVHRVFVTTFAKVLQDQISDKDIPLLNDCLDLGLSAVVIKGKANYVCLKRFREYMTSVQNQSKGVMEHPHLDIMERWQKWLETTQTGDKAEIVDDSAWQFVCVDDDCDGQDCPLYQKCLYYKMRKAAETADIIIGNHTLLCLDLAVRANSDGKAQIVPDYDRLIVDEGHHLEDVAIDAFSAQLTDSRIRRICNSINSQMPFIELGAIQELNVALFDWYWQRRPQPKNSWERQETTWILREKPTETVQSLMRELMRVSANIKRFCDNETPEGRQAQRLLNRLGLAVSDLGRIMNLANTQEAHWAEMNTQQDGIILKATPLQVAPILREQLFSKVPTVITSATIAVNRKFDYLKSVLGIDDAIEKIVGSPFDYERNCMLYIPIDLPEPVPASTSDSNHPYWQAYIQQSKKLIETSRGSILFLFTSWGSLKLVKEGIFGSEGYFPGTLVYNNRATGERYPVFIQGEGSVQQNIEGFKKAGNAILFGVASFWEGFDVQGDALRCVVIEKMPFEVPTHPVTQARLEAAGSKAFSTFSVPRAVVKFKQGFGRLIRSKADRGVAVIMDTRLITKGYGSIFLNSLPNLKLRTRAFGPVEQFFRGEL